MSRGDYFINRFCYDLAKNMAKQDMIIQKQIEKKKMELEEVESKAFEEFHGYPKYVENYKTESKKDVIISIILLLLGSFVTFTAIFVGDCNFILLIFGGLMLLLAFTGFKESKELKEKYYEYFNERK